MATPPEADQYTEDMINPNYGKRPGDRSINLTRYSNIPTSIPEFYAHRSVFITGGTGFMGKVRISEKHQRQSFNNQCMIISQVLVEKLLRSCPEIRNIYLLMRPKRGQEVNTRLTELLASPVR